MKKSIACGLTLCCLFLGKARAEEPTQNPTPAAAAPTAPASGGMATGEMPKPSPEMEKLKGLLATGEWKCEGNMQAPGTATPHKMSAKKSIKSDLTGFWQMARIETKKSKENPNPMAMVEWYSWDMNSKMFMRTAMDSMGNMATLTSQGVDGDKMTFTGDVNMNGTKSPARVTYEKKGKEMMVSWEMGSADGQWTKTLDMTCKK